MESKEYWAEIRALVGAYAEAVTDGDITDDESASDWLHETIDGHQFVIYTYKAKCVGIHTDHPDPMIDEMGSDGLIRDNRINYEAIAYWAMLTDVQERLPALTMLLARDQPTD